MGQDNKIREKLNAREIQPSSESWDRLDAMLSVKEEKKNKRGFSWLYIAASFLVFTGLGFWLYPENKEVIPVENNIVVEENNKIDTNILALDSLKTEEVLVESKMQSNSQEKAIQPKVIERKYLNQEKNVVAVNSNQNNNIRKFENSIIQNEVVEVKVVEKVLNKKTFKIKIDANSLLSAAENEMDNEYKETNLDKLSRSFKEVKSALANRNYE
jgi:hypothetical protein